MKMTRRKLGKEVKEKVEKNTTTLWEGSLVEP
jgi:hypothetical protein